MYRRAKRGVHDSMVGRTSTSLGRTSTSAPDLQVRLPGVFPASTRTSVALIHSLRKRSKLLLRRRAQPPAGLGGCSGLAQAVTVLAISARPRSWISISRIRNFWILPVTVIGNESTNRISAGTLKYAIRPRQ